MHLLLTIWIVLVSLSCTNSNFKGDGFNSTRRAANSSGEPHQMDNDSQKPTGFQSDTIFQDGARGQNNQSSLYSSGDPDGNRGVSNAVLPQSGTSAEASNPDNPHTPDSHGPDPSRLNAGDSEVWCFVRGSSSSLNQCNWQRECQKFATKCKSGRSELNEGGRIAGHPEHVDNFGPCKSEPNGKFTDYVTPCGKSRKGGIRIRSMQCRCL